MYHRNNLANGNSMSSIMLLTKRGRISRVLGRWRVVGMSWGSERVCGGWAYTLGIYEDWHWTQDLHVMDPQFQLNLVTLLPILGGGW